MEKSVWMLLNQGYFPLEKWFWKVCKFFFSLAENPSTARDKSRSWPTFV